MRRIPDTLAQRQLANLLDKLRRMLAFLHDQTVMRTGVAIRTIDFM